ncbi:MAG: fused MFS/spermidine synthase [Betaproteobacteria bacterium]|nr:fused MFS/spermidine synthase [Betaproteobacteria bacterium]
MLLYAAAISCSAFLLFLVQPIIAKQILPWFGGTAAVWTTCLVFFQTTLLLGYFYSDWTTRKLTPRTQLIMHGALLVVAMALLPIIPDAAWKPAGDESPSLRIILLLAATIGLPYFLLSTTSPLIQAWFARTYPHASPYRLFALSNLASMVALLGYPFLIEPRLPTQFQAVIWSVGFGLFALLCVGAGWFTLRSAHQSVAGSDGPLSMTSPGPATAYEPPPTLSDKLTWVALAALGSVLLLAVSNHLTQNISSIPLLWVLPLAIYLLSFILCFDGEGWYPRTLFLPWLGVALLCMGWMLADKDMHFELYWQTGLFCVGLFIACMFCHGELARLKPAPRHLTTFYVMVSLGGALGAVLVGLLAPLVLPAYFELEVALVAFGAMAVYLLRKERWFFIAPAVVVTVATGVAGGYAIHQYVDNTMVMTRNFYGTLRVREYGAPTDKTYHRSLVHGGILHGEQYMQPEYRAAATTYYKTSSGIGKSILLKQQLLGEKPMKVGVIGLGTGTIATYGRKGDTYRFYDINPEVITIARRDFTYLADSDALIELSLGDARLNLEREAVQGFDVLAVDAFSSDSIPVHLITLEAVQIYLKHMKPNGVIAFHVSNRFLDLKPVVEKIGNELGLTTAWVHEVAKNEDSDRTVSDWVLLSKDKRFLLRDPILDATFIITPQPGWRLWTDDYNNLVQVLK